jgi:hypothetical protein
VTLETSAQRQRIMETWKSRRGLNFQRITEN